MVWAPIKKAFGFNPHSDFYQRREQTAKISERQSDVELVKKFCFKIREGLGTSVVSGKLVEATILRVFETEDPIFDICSDFCGAAIHYHLTDVTTTVGGTNA